MFLEFSSWVYFISNDDILFYCRIKWTGSSKQSLILIHSHVKDVIFTITILSFFGDFHIRVSSFHIVLSGNTDSCVFSNFIGYFYGWIRRINQFNSMHFSLNSCVKVTIIIYNFWYIWFKLLTTFFAFIHLNFSVNNPLL